MNIAQNISALGHLYMPKGAVSNSQVNNRITQPSGGSLMGNQLDTLNQLNMGLKGQFTKSNGKSGLMFNFQSSHSSLDKMSVGFRQPALTNVFETNPNGLVKQMFDQNPGGPIDFSRPSGGLVRFLDELGVRANSDGTITTSNRRPSLSPWTGTLNDASAGASPMAVPINLHSNLASPLITESADKRSSKIDLATFGGIKLADEKFTRDTQGNITQGTAKLFFPGNDRESMDVMLEFDEGKNISGIRFSGPVELMHIGQKVNENSDNYLNITIGEGGVTAIQKGAFRGAVNGAQTLQAADTANLKTGTNDLKMELFLESINQEAIGLAPRDDLMLRGDDDDSGDLITWSKRCCIIDIFSKSEAANPTVGDNLKANPTEGLLLRKEEDGGLMWNMVGKEVWKLNDTAYNTVKDLENGYGVNDVAKRNSLELQSVSNFVTQLGRLK